MEQIPLSVHTVMADDDLLNEILVRLPVASLVLFKSVSTRWHSLIKSPTFIRRRSRIPKIDPPSGLFIQRDSKRSPLFGFVPFDIRIPPRLENTFKAEYDGIISNVTVFQSCNGLFLGYVKAGEFCVYNPTLYSFKMLPEPLYSKPQPPKKGFFVSMSFDPTKSPHYKVVHAEPITDDHPAQSYRIQIYSSESGSWSIVWSHGERFDGMQCGICCNDAIHWINYDDHDEALHYKLDFAKSPAVLTKIQLPVTMAENGQLFESRGCFFLLGMDKTRSHDQLNVYEMGKGNSGWSLKYSVNQWRMNICGVWCISMGEKEDDSYMVIELNGKVFLYYFALKTFRVLPEVQRMLPKSRGFYSIGSFLFTASFASV